MNKFHVVIKTKSDDSWKCCFKDLSEKELIYSFVKPYKKGKEIIVDGEIISTKEINHVVISKTDKTHKEELKIVQDTSYQKIQEMNRNSSIRIISPGYGWQNYEIKDCGENVTSYYLTSGAGEVGFMNSPWVITIGGGLVVGVLLLLLS
ncbi:hypothetical protein [Vibrio cholerae]|uniref:hypothetical protein n=1 Tax=Vibrio cholerae TaxID=666 RepID=UPI003080F71E